MGSPRWVCFHLCPQSTAACDANDYSGKPSMGLLPPVRTVHCRVWHKWLQSEALDGFVSTCAHSPLPCVTGQPQSIHKLLFCRPSRIECSATFFHKDWQHQWYAVNVQYRQLLVIYVTTLKLTRGIWTRFKYMQLLRILCKSVNFYHRILHHNNSVNTHKDYII